MSRTIYDGIEVHPLDAALGAEVRCGDLRHLSIEQFGRRGSTTSCCFFAASP
jgi:hypothetical protein